VSESQIIRRLAWHWFMGQGPICSARGLGRRLGVSHTWIQKLVREFVADPSNTIGQVGPAVPLSALPEWYANALISLAHEERENAERLGHAPGPAGFLADGRMRIPYLRYLPATFEQLRAAQEETRNMRERNLLRGPRLWKIVEYKIGDNFVRARVPTKAYAAVLAASNCAPTAIPINKRMYVKGGRNYPVGIDQRGRLRLGDLKKSQVSAISGKT
jgi:hypothetical protein